MDRFHVMQVFVRVAETGSFGKAARQLNLSPPSVTRAIASVEDRLGTRLFVRTTRHVKMTEAGENFFGDCKRILADVEEAEVSAAGAYAEPTGTLTVSAPVLFGQMHLMPILTDFLDRHPSVTGRVLLLDRVTNLIEEGIDVAVRIGHLPDSSLIATRVGFVRRVVVGAPDYFAARGMPLEPADLLQHRLIAPTAAWTSLDWRFSTVDKTNIHVSPALFCNTNEAAIDAAVRGWGLTRVLSYQVSAQVKAGVLQPVLTEWEQEPLPIHIVHPEGRHPSAKVRAFVDQLVDRLREVFSSSKNSDF